MKTSASSLRGILKFHWQNVIGKDSVTHVKSHNLMLPSFWVMDMQCVGPAPNQIEVILQYPVQLLHSAERVNNGKEALWHYFLVQQNACFVYILLSSRESLSKEHTFSLQKSHWCPSIWCTTLSGGTNMWVIMHF